MGCDCVIGDDEDVVIDINNLCTRVRRHRLQCLSEQPTCLSPFRFEDSISQCSNKYDEYIYGYGRPVVQFPCRKSDLANCQLLKEYIQNPSLISNSSTNSYSHIHESQNQMTSQTPFRFYCDTIWHLPEHIDEFPQYCNNWVCHRDQYQCRTGQYIRLAWVCDGQWDCVDASDEGVMLAIHHWSLHNRQVRDLDKKRKICLQRYSDLPFSQFSDMEKEFPSLRSNVFSQCLIVTMLMTKRTHFNLMMDKCGVLLFNDLQACDQNVATCAQIFCPSRHYRFSDCSAPVRRTNYLLQR